MHYLFRLLAVAAAITLIAGCGKFSPKDKNPSARSKADAERMLTEFNKTDINSYPAATQDTTKADAEKHIKDLTRYKKVGTDVLKINIAKDLKLENSTTVAHNIETADALIHSYKTQIQKLDLEYQK